MKPVQRSLGIGADHIETVGGVRATPASFILTEEAYGEATRTHRVILYSHHNLPFCCLACPFACSQRERYVKHMLSHAERISRVTASIDLSPPVAAFGGGRYRTPHAAGLSGKKQALTQEAFSEVREAFRRVAEVHQGARKSSMQTRQPREMESLAQKISRNRKLGSKQFLADEAHAAELYHLQRRIASSGSLTERKKNRLDPTLYPVIQMRNYRHASAADLLDMEYARRAGYSQHAQQRPHSARAASASQPPPQQPVGSGSVDLTAAAVPAATAQPTGSASARGGAAGRKPASATVRPGSARGGPASAKRGGGGAAGADGAASSAAFGDLSLGKPTRDVAALRRRLLEQIVDRRLFREAELRPFLQAVVRANKQIEAALLKEAVRDVEREFYLLS
jgi:hypothetical protein